MDAVQGFLIAAGWFVLRFGLPIMVTIVICKLFQKMDLRWMVESKAYREKAGIADMMPAIRCWAFNDCSEEKKKECHAYQNKNIPCWQLFRSQTGELKEDCLGCGVFRGTPVPAIGD